LIVLGANKLHVFVLTLISYVNHFLLLLFSLFTLLHALHSLPCDAITYGFSTTAENWEGIEPWIVAENLLKIIVWVDVVVTFEWLPLFLQILNSGFIFPGKLDMEFQESCD